MHLSTAATEYKTAHHSTMSACNVNMKFNSPGYKRSYFISGQ